MAFCNSCGTSLAPGVRFCSKCGAAILASSPVPPAAGGPTPPPAYIPPATSAPVPAPGGGGALKVVLIVVGIFVVLGVFGLASVGFVAWRVAHRTRVHQSGDNVKVETPFGNVETTKDPAEAARNLGVDLYPGAEVLKEGAASATFGTLRTVSLTSESKDSVDKVTTFYKTRFPNAMVTTSDSGRCSIISNDHKNMVTINIESDGDKTKIHITNVTHKSDAAHSSSN